MPLEQRKVVTAADFQREGVAKLASEQKAMSNEDYANFQKILEDSSGIVLGDNKQYLVKSRLTRLMAELEIDSFSILMSKMKTDGRLRKQIMDAMTTNETSWFRDTYPYEILKERLLPEFAKSNRSRVKIWSAACSTGQEPYSISMVASEYMMSKPGAIAAGGIEIIGTDLSNTVLEHAKEGIYDASIADRGLTKERKQRFFHEKEGRWQINDDLKKRISFREMNLMQSYTLLGKFDIIFCRNVLIYFSAELKRDIMYRMSQALNKDGYLILGGSESISGYCEEFDLVRWKSGVVYKLKSR